MKSLGLISSIVMAFAVVFVASTAYAYEEDVHFYEAYMLARYAGINHEVSAKLATFNQWIDVSGLTSPMFPTLAIGSRMRRLYHFPTELIAYNTSDKSTAHGMQLNLFGGLTRENNPLASELLMEGMKTGNLLMVGAGLHTLMDSFGHSNYSFVTGHAEAGHWPDRPWVDMEKHKRMNETYFKALVAIRKLLPENALDKNFRDGSGAPNYQMSAKELYENYTNNEMIQKTLKHNPFLDPTYTRTAMKAILEGAKNRGYVTGDVNILEILERDHLFERNLDVRQILESLLENAMSKKGGLQSIVNMQKLGETLSLPLDRVSIEEIGKDYFMKRTISTLTDGLIPTAMDATHHVAYEGTDSLRALEIEIKQTLWQNTIEKIAHNRIEFQPRKILERVKDYIAKWRGKPMENSLASVEVITASWGERAKWVFSLFKFGFLDILLQGKYRARADKMNMLYQYESTFQELIEQGKVKKLMSEEQINILKANRQKMLSENELPDLSTQIRGRMCRGVFL